MQIVTKKARMHIVHSRPLMLHPSIHCLVLVKIVVATEQLSWYWKKETCLLSNTISIFLLRIPSNPWHHLRDFTLNWCPWCPSLCFLCLEFLSCLRPLINVSLFGHTGQKPYCSHCHYIVGIRIRTSLLNIILGFTEQSIISILPGR